MSAEPATITVDVADLERLLRRVVREELARAVTGAPGSMLADWSQEGPDDPEGDRKLLAESLAVVEAHGEDPAAWVSWEDFERELDESEARGEVSR